MVSYDGQIVDVTFHDGRRVRAHIVSVDPHVRDNHVFYFVIDVLEHGNSEVASAPLSAGCACSAHEIASLSPTDGLRHSAPGSKR